MPSDPRAFLSYARADGESFARQLRERLKKQEPEITLWQDRSHMRGGEDWWLQIVEALDKVRFLVLVVTKAALASGVVQKEWRLARQKGVCVAPVAGVADLPFASMAKWMSAAHFYDLDKEWQTFVSYLKSPCREPRIPFMAPELPSGAVRRQATRQAVLDRLLDGGNPRPGTVSLYGGPGFGKTTLAAELCGDDAVLTAYDHGVLWATLGQQPNAQAELSKLYAALTGERPAFIDADDASLQLGDVLRDRRCLMVVDDAWNPAHLRPFFRGGPQCARLVTTRVSDVAAQTAARVDVAEMSEREAVSLLTNRLPQPPADLGPFRKLAARLGEWPLLLELVGASIGQRLQRGDAITGALTYVEQVLERRGLGGFDLRKPQNRNQAIALTMEVSLEMLDPAERRHYQDLSVFPEGIDVPLGAVGDLTGLDQFEAGELGERLANLSLLKLRLPEATIRLHDAVRAYLEGQVPDADALHCRLAEAWGQPETLPESYSWRLIGHHLVKAMETAAPDALHRRAQAVVDFLTSGEAGRVGVRQLDDLAALRGLLATTVDCVARDEDGAAPLTLARAALNLATLRETRLGPKDVFRLAREGKLQEARDRLELFEPDPTWRQVALLTLAWLLPADAAADTEALRTQVRAEASDPTVRLLADRMPLGRKPQPLAQPLPPPPPPYVAESILQRLSGGGDNPNLLEPLAGTKLLAAQGDNAPAFLAAADGPQLVAYAAQPGNADEQAQRDGLVRRYLGVHASNPYSHYRNRSLWLLIPHILEHPDPAWVQEMLTELEAAALHAVQKEFREAVPMAVDAAAARTGNAEAAQRLEDLGQRTLDEARQTATRPVGGDPWSYLLRRLAALAEAHALGLQRKSEAEALLQRAFDLPFGLAGYRAGALATLVEATRISGAEHLPGYNGLWKQALQAAHNVQDSAFCARVTSRTNALKARRDGKGAASQTSDLVRRFVANPAAAEFCALHLVGERYEFRTDAYNRLPIPDRARQADSLEKLGHLYGESPEALRRVNPGVDPQAVLPVGTPVNIPDLGFGPALAAHLAALVLISADDARDKTRTLQSLVPIAIANQTALDSVLARLVLVAMPADTGALQALRRSAWDVSAADGAH
jgi:hypothetical protein